jgi:hypothetical protein
MTDALPALLFHVDHFPVADQFEVPADDTAAGQGGKAEEPDEAHD